MTDHLETILRDEFASQAARAPHPGDAAAVAREQVGRQRRRRGAVLAAAVVVAAVLVASAALRGTGSPTTLPADGGTSETGGSIPSGAPLTAAQTARSRTALWASCSDPGQDMCTFTVATTNAGWDASTVLTFPSKLVPRLVVLRSGDVAVLADGPRGWLMAGGDATPLRFPTARIKPSGSVTLTSAPPGTPDGTLDNLTQQDIEAGKDTNADIWAIDEATGTAAIHWSQPGSPASLAAEPVRVGTTTFAALSVPSGAEVEITTIDDDGSTSEKVRYVQGEPRWATALAVGSDGTIAVTDSAPGAQTDVWVLRKAQGDWVQLPLPPFHDVESLAVTDDGAVIVLDAATGQTLLYDPLDRLMPGNDTLRLRTLRSNDGYLVGVTTSGAIASTRDGRSWVVTRPTGSSAAMTLRPNTVAPVTPQVTPGRQPLDRPVPGAAIARLEAAVHQLTEPAPGMPVALRARLVHYQVDSWRSSDDFTLLVSLDLRFKPGTQMAWNNGANDRFVHFTRKPTTGTYHLEWATGP